VRGEDLDEDISATADYLTTLRMSARHRRMLQRLLGALRPYDPACVVELLLAGCAAAAAGGTEAGARGLAELAYEAAAAHHLDAGAQGAALALARLAKLQEAPWSARMWSAIGRMHARRFARQRFARV
jgi:hypothetical protein